VEFRGKSKQLEKTGIYDREVKGENVALGWLSSGIT